FPGLVRLAVLSAGGALGHVAGPAPSVSAPARVCGDAPSLDQPSAVAGDQSNVRRLLLALQRIHFPSPAARGEGDGAPSPAGCADETHGNSDGGGLVSHALLGVRSFGPKAHDIPAWGPPPA